MAALDAIPLPSLAVAAVHGGLYGYFAGGDQAKSVYGCATHEHKVWVSAGGIVLGLGLEAVAANPEIGSGLATAGAALLGSRLALGAARGSQYPKGSGCP